MWVLHFFSFLLSVRTNKMYMIVSSCANHISPYVCDQNHNKNQVSRKWKPAPHWSVWGKGNAELLWEAVSGEKHWVTTVKMTVKETKVLVVKGTVCFLLFCQWSSLINNCITRSMISVTVFTMLHDCPAFQDSGNLRTFFNIWYLRVGGRVPLSSRHFPLLTSEGRKAESTIVPQLTVSTKLSQHLKSL